MDLYEFEASLVCRVRSRTVRAEHENFISKIQSKKKKKKNETLTSFLQKNQT